MNFETLFTTGFFPFLTVYFYLVEILCISVVFFYGTIPFLRGQVGTISANLSKEYKQSMRVPSNLHDILIGLLLGDLHISRDYKNSRLQFKQDDPNKSYLSHLHDLFINYTMASIYKEVSFHKKEKTSHTS